MKRLLLTLTLLAGMLFGVAQAQEANYALIDMQYLSSKLPPYKKATEQLKSLTEKWEKEINAYREEAKKMYTKYQKDMPTLSAQAKVQREEAIINTEERVRELQQKYFGPKGELTKKQEELIKPIQDNIYEAVKLISAKRGYLMVLDRASVTGIIFADPRADISNDVLAVLGYRE
ncbi:OmpH family outer membrane protein [Porphyromonas sp.]|uniref:OmpH family outer membrane protein n=1 Tax=Porphyromonas sp. TaxID=1924944 RepID=UPI0026DC0035|nr:OmpH family outer membrane protein [Porphyromonas sp.]MDO4770941.1 OmpH family outer membrane protein [Porphyromonas sp.]